MWGVGVGVGVRGFATTQLKWKEDEMKERQKRRLHVLVYKVAEQNLQNRTRRHDSMNGFVLRPVSFHRRKESKEK